jgi:hypothetical protein
MKTIKIYNHAHYGDIFYSRMLINSLKSHYKIEYYHNNSLVLNDIKEVTEIIGIPSEFDMNRTDIQNGLINAWIGQGCRTYVHNERGCDFNNHLSLVKNVCEELNVELNPQIDYLPYVNYNNLQNIQSLKSKIELIKLKYDKIILVCDGDVRSGQSENFNFSDILLELSTKYKNYFFLSTNNNFDLPNLISTHPNLTSGLPDLLEISYISKFCDVIVGRSSGPFCYTHTLENFYNKEKTFISFTHNKYEGVFFNESTCKNIWSNNFNLNSIYETIDSNIIN